MAAATDEAGIQFRILNGSKGPAVRATRAQADRVLYRAAIRRRLENQPNLWLFQGACDDLIVEGDRVAGVVTQVGVRFAARAVVLTAGTFLDGRIHVGLQSHAGGRAGDPPAVDAVGAAEGAEAAAGPAEDRHAAAARRPDDRLRQPARAARRRRRPGRDPLDDVPVFSFLGDAGAASAPGVVLDHADQRAHARDHPRRLRPQPDVHRRDRRRRSALLPEHRGQGQPLRRQGLAPDLPRARGPDDARGLPERHLDLAAVRRAARRGALDRRAGERAHPAARATRSSTTTSIRAR